MSDLKGTKKNFKKGAPAKKKTAEKEIVRDRFLPIGSVVLLDGGYKRVMVTGFCVKQNKNQNKVWDYCGVIFPEGTLSSDQILLFDHKQIEKIYFVGFENDNEERFFKEVLNTTIKSLNNTGNGKSTNRSNRDRKPKANL